MEAALLTEDLVLGGRIVLRQPSDGLRATIDPLLLAAAVPAKPGERILELGCGSGVASLCLACRLPDTLLVGLEADPALAALANENARRNGLECRVVALEGDVAAPPPTLIPASFDHVMANPPYLPAGQGTLPPSSLKAAAIGEHGVALGQWLDLAFAMVRRHGSVAIVQRADRLSELLRLFERRTGEIIVVPLWPMAGKPATRVIVRGRLGRRTPLSLAAGLILHEADGRYTAAAEAVLRHAQPLI
jgi:tRNA1(Val) A37 N6-methylase TrmN6